MADSGAIRAGRAFVELFADDSKLVRGLKQAGTKLKTWGDSISSVGKRMAGLGLGAMGGLFAAAKAAGDLGGSLKDMSDRTGMSVEGIQELGYAAKMTGASTEDLETGVRKMQKTIAEAASGSDTAQKALADLGLSVAALSGLSPEQQFEAIADRLDKVQDPAQKAAAAMEIFGKSGTKLIPMMAGGAAAIEKMRAKARELGLVLSAEDVEAADKFGDTLDTLWSSLKVGFARIGVALLPMLTDMAGKMIEVSGKVGMWISANQGLIVSAFKIAAGFTAAGVGIFALGKLFTGVGLGLKIAAGVFSGIGSVLGVIGMAFAALTSPIGLVIAAVAAAGGAFLYVSGVGGDVVNYLAGAFESLKSDAIASFGAIGNALAAGDMAAAASVLWSLLKMEWVKGTSELKAIWAKASAGMQTIATDGWHGMVAGGELVFHGLEVAWIETTAFISRAWTSMLSAMHKAWNWIATKVQQGMNLIRGMFDETFDAGLANKALQTQLASENANIDKTKESQLAAREKVRQVDRKQAADAHDATLGEIGKEMIAKEDSIDTERTAALKSAREAADKAKADWAASVATANSVSSARATGQGMPEGYKAPPSLAGVDTTGQSKTSAVGTFSAASVRGLGTGSPVTSRLDAMITHLKKVSDNTGRDKQGTWAS